MDLDEIHRLLSVHLHPLVLVLENDREPVPDVLLQGVSGQPVRFPIIGLAVVLRGVVDRDAFLAVVVRVVQVFPDDRVGSRPLVRIAGAGRDEERESFRRIVALEDIQAAPQVGLQVEMRGEGLRPSARVAQGQLDRDRGRQEVDVERADAGDGERLRELVGRSRRRLVQFDLALAVFALRARVAHLQRSVGEGGSRGDEAPVDPGRLKRPVGRLLHLDRAGDGAGEVFVAHAAERGALLVLVGETHLVAEHESGLGPVVGGAARVISVFSARIEGAARDADGVARAEIVDVLARHGVPACQHEAHDGQFDLVGEAVARRAEGPNIALANSGRAYYGDHLEGTVTASGFGTYTASGTVQTTLNATLSKHLQMLNKIRLKVPALRRGQYSPIGSGMSFVRRYTSGNIDSIACVAISGGASFSGLPNGSYVDLVSGNRINVSNGSLNVNISGQGNIAIYVQENSSTGTLGKIS